MAFLPPKEENLDAPQGQTSNDPGGEEPPAQTGGSVGDGGGTGISGSKGTATGTPTQFGSSSSKLGDYLSANAPQITQQAAGIAGNLNNQFGQIQGDINQGVSQFGQQVQQGYTAANPDVVNQATKDPTKFVQDPNNVAAFQAQYNNQYKGPQNFESTTPYSNVQNEVNNAVKGAQALGTQGGLENYFAGQGRNPTQASNTLDSLLIQGNPEAQQQVTTAANQFNGLGDQLTQGTTSANAQAQAAQKAAQDASNYAHTQIGQTVDQFGNSLNSNLTQAEQQRQAYNKQLGDLQAKATPLVAPINSFIQSNPGWGLTNYFQDVPGMSSVINPATLSNTANADQYARDAALSQLLGQDYTAQLNPSDIGQAGTFKAPENTPNFNDLLTNEISNFGHTAKEKVKNDATALSSPQFQNLAELLSAAEPDSKNGWSDTYHDIFGRS